MEKDIRELIENMTLEEKASLCSGLDFWKLKGIERLNIPSIMVTDGPHGLRKQDGASDHIGLNKSVPATCFPTAAGLASTWDRELIYEVGKALGEECRQEKVSVLLGPGANIKRSPLCGRNFEYFSEDPYLTGEMAAYHINGVQSQGIGTSLKHYAANNQEYHRMTIDTIVDERTLREIYLAGFEKAVKEAQPWTVMCAYNKINGVYASENEYLLTDILKKEWKHEGLVVTDWGACNNRVEGLKAGLELEMPGNGGMNDRKIIKAIKKGELKEEVLNKAVERLLNLIVRSEKRLKEEYHYNQKAHHALARKASSDGMILLKNEDTILPLKKDAKIGIVGDFAKHPRYQGSGSSLINPIELDNAFDEISKVMANDGEVLYAKGYDVETDKVSQGLIDEACEVARKVEVVVVFAGLTDIYESEGFDREHMKLPVNHNALINAVSKENKNVVVVLSNGSPVQLPWINEVKGVIEGYLGGEASGAAFCDVLFGDVNPSGKLAETFPLQLEDNPSYPYFPSGPKAVEYREGIYVGYRYYDRADKEVLFPFGYGLSYTTFEYSDISINQKSIYDNQNLKVTVKVKNTGSLKGKEVVQLYVRDVNSTIFRPVKELKGFEKVELGPNEEKTVTFTLDKRAFAYYNVDIKDWYVETGDFEILIGSSSRDIRLRETIHVISTYKFNESIQSLENKLPSYYNVAKDWRISKEEFETLLGKSIVSNNAKPDDCITINSVLGDIKDNKVGKKLYEGVMSNIDKMFESDDNKTTKKLFITMIEEMPLRNLVMMSNGEMSYDMIDALILMMNGKKLSGVLKMIKAKIGKA